MVGVGRKGDGCFVSRSVESLEEMLGGWFSLLRRTQISCQMKRKKHDAVMSEMKRSDIYCYVDISTEKIS